MPIVATTDTRNSQWANDQSSFGRKMLAKMGWKGDGSGLGKTQQGTSTHLRAVRRAESLGIGAENDAFGEKGWQDTNAGFHGVLANLKREYSSVGGGSRSSDRDCDSDVDKEEGIRTKKKNKKIRKENEKKQTNDERNKKKKENDGTRDKTRGGDATSNGLRLPQNKVQAGHARKMREAKDIRNKSIEDMAAIFGVKADFYQMPRDWINKEGELGNSSGTNISGCGGGEDRESSAEAVEKKEKRKKRKSQKKSKGDSDSSSSSDNNEFSHEISKEDKKKRKRSKDDDEINTSDREEKRKSKSRR